MNKKSKINEDVVISNDKNIIKKIEEDYFFNTFEDATSNSNKFFVLIIYDISETKRRNKIFKILNSYGFRVQRSAFEATLSPSKYKKLIKDIKHIPSNTDSVRVYKIQGKGSVVQFGEETYIEDEDVIII